MATKAERGEDKTNKINGVRNSGLLQFLRKNMEIQFKHLQRIIKIVFHNTAVSYLKNPDQWEATNNYHKKIFKPYEKNWADYKSSLGFYNGYNFEIAMNGKTRQARKIGETTGAVYQQGLNSGIAVHIALDGAFDIELPTRDHERALKDLLIKLLSLCENVKEISYHRDFAVKTCPGKLIKDDWAQNLISNNKEMKLIREKGRRETFAVINGKNYYIRNVETFEDLQSDGHINWEDVEEVNYAIRIDGVIAG